MADNEKTSSGGHSDKPDTSNKPAAGRGGRPNSSRRPRNRGGKPRVAAPAPPVAKPANGSGTSTIISVAALLLSVAVAAGGYFVWQEVQRQGTGQSKVEDTVGNRFLQVQSETRKATDEVRQELDRLRGRLESSLTDGERNRLAVEQSMSKLREQMGRTHDGWMLAEVRYLMRIANQKLNLQGDVPTALAALQAADARLKELGDPGLLSVRELVAGEITRLQAVSQPDLGGVVLKLRKLQDQVDRLKLEGTQYRPPEPGESGQALSGVDLKGDWRELPTKVWEGLRELVAVRHHDKPVGPMLAPQNQVFLYQNIHLQLEAAALAALKGEQAMYEASLARVTEWISRFFDQSDQATQAMLSGIAGIEGVTLRPALPDISSSLRLLRQQMDLNAASSKPEAKSIPAEAPAPAAMDAQQPAVAAP